MDVLGSQLNKLHVGVTRVAGLPEVAAARPSPLLLGVAPRGQVSPCGGLRSGVERLWAVLLLGGFYYVLCKGISGRYPPPRRAARSACLLPVPWLHRLTMSPRVRGSSCVLGACKRCV